MACYSDDGLAGSWPHSTSIIVNQRSSGARKWLCRFSHDRCYFSY